MPLPLPQPLPLPLPLPLPILFQRQYRKSLPLFMSPRKHFRLL
jgi:hypothetical protein